MQARAKAIKMVATLEHDLLLANDKNTRKLVESQHASKACLNWHAVTSTHIPLVRLHHEAKHKVSGVGKISPTYREA